MAEVSPEWVEAHVVAQVESLDRWVRIMRLREPDAQQCAKLAKLETRLRAALFWLREGDA